MGCVSERVWWCSNLPERDDGKETLKELTEIEHAVGPLPDWAISIAGNNINYFPPCGHEMFKHNINAILEAIERRREVESFFYCFMVSNGTLAKAQQALKKCSDHHPSSPAGKILADRLRWWETVNSRIKGNPFSGDAEGCDYYEWDEKTKNTIHSSGLSPDDELVKKIKNTWLCAPKAFRFIEKIGIEMNMSLDGFDAYDKESFRKAIVGALERIESAILDAKASGDSVARFLLALLKAKLIEYTQKGILKKVLKT